MALHINADLIKRLEAIAQDHQQDASELANTAIENYLNERERFKERIQEAIHKHKWLLDELAKR